MMNIGRRGVDDPVRIQMWIVKSGYSCRLIRSGYRCEFFLVSGVQGRSCMKRFYKLHLLNLHCYFIFTAICVWLTYIQQTSSVFNIYTDIFHFHGLGLFLRYQQLANFLTCVRTHSRLNVYGHTIRPQVFEFTDRVSVRQEIRIQMKICPNSRTLIG